MTELGRHILCGDEAVEIIVVDDALVHAVHGHTHVVVTVGRLDGGSEVIAVVNPAIVTVALCHGMSVEDTITSQSGVVDVHSVFSEHGLYVVVGHEQGIKRVGIGVGSFIVNHIGGHVVAIHIITFYRRLVTHHHVIEVVVWFSGKIDGMCSRVEQRVCFGRDEVATHFVFGIGVDSNLVDVEFKFEEHLNRMCLGDVFQRVEHEACVVLVFVHHALAVNPDTGHVVHFVRNDVDGEIVAINHVVDTGRRYSTISIALYVGTHADGNLHDRLNVQVVEGNTHVATLAQSLHGNVIDTGYIVVEDVFVGLISIGLHEVLLLSDQRHGTEILRGAHIDVQVLRQQTHGVVVVRNTDLTGRNLDTRSDEVGLGINGIVVVIFHHAAFLNPLVRVVVGIVIHPSIATEIDMGSERLIVRQCGRSYQTHVIQNNGVVCIVFVNVI